MDSVVKTEQTKTELPQILQNKVRIWENSVLYSTYPDSPMGQNKRDTGKADIGVASDM
jgi:hypothetical protein